MVSNNLTPADTFGIPVVTSVTQGRPTSEEQAQAFSDAFDFAEMHPNDVGYPWIDPKTDALELSAASARGRENLTTFRASIATPTRIRDVTRSFGELEALKHEITTLRAQGVPDADLLFKSTPDHKNNRIVIGVTKPSATLFRALRDRYGTGAIALLVDPDGAGVSTGATRQTDFSPYWGGAKIVTPSYTCSDAFSWRISGVDGDAMLTAAHCISTGGSVSIGQQSGSGTVLSQTHENWSDVHGTQFYTGDSVLRGDVALIRLASTRSSDPYIYRGGKDSSSFSPVLSYYQRNSKIGDVVYWRRSDRRNRTLHSFGARDRSDLRPSFGQVGQECDRGSAWCDRALRWQGGLGRLCVLTRHGRGQGCGRVQRLHRLPHLLH